MKLTVALAPHLRRAGLVISIVSLVAIAFATLTPEPADDIGSHFCLVCGSFGGVSALLNVFLFVPLGVGLALSGWPAKRALLCMCALSVLIETAQLVIPGRDSTLGDVLTNSFGGALGFAIGRYAFTLLRPSPRIALALCMGWSAVWLGIQTISGFGLSLAIPNSEYYGQIARRLGNFEQFRGRVLRASIADIEVSDTRFENNAEMRELLLRGATVTTTVVPSNPTHNIAPIVRVADARDREIVLLAQSGKDLVFGVRTGAAVLRLRPPFFAVADVFPAVSSGNVGPAADAVTVSARYSTRGVSVNTQTAGTSFERRIPITASLGWTMLMPFQWRIEGTNIELVLSAIWIACLLLPLGYWGGGMTRLSGGRDATRVRMTAVPIALVLLYLGLVVVPQSFGVTAAPLTEWLAALTGIFSGAGLASRANGAF
jgi:VanZ family protein